MAETTELIIKRQQLAEAEPAVGMMPVTQITPDDRNRMRALGELLANAYHTGQFRKMPWPDNFNKETPEIRRGYREMLRDGTIRSAFYSKILSVASLDVQVMPSEQVIPERGESNHELTGKTVQEVADFIKWNLTQGCLGGFPKIARSILEGGLSEGYSLCEPKIDIQRRGQYRLKYTLQKFKAKDSRLYDLEVDNFDEIKSVYVKATNRRIKPERFVIWSYLAMFEAVVGSSDFRACYREFLIIDVAMKMAAIDVERFVLPMMKGNYKQADQKELMEEALRTARSLGFAALPEGATIEALQLATAGPDRIDARIKMCQANVFTCITGASLQAMEGQKTGSLAQGRVHQNQSQLPIWFLASEIAEVLNSQIVPMLVDLNYGEECGLPRVVISGVDDAATTGFADLVEKAQRMGLKPSRKDVATRLGIQEAQRPDDELLPSTGGLNGGGTGAGGPPGGAGGAGVATDSLSGMGIFNQRQRRRGKPRGRSVRYSSIAICGGGANNSDDEDDAAVAAFAESPGPSLQTNLVAASGQDERRVLKLLQTARETGVKLLTDLARQGLIQGLASRESTNFIWTPDQQIQLAGFFTSLLATGEMLGRARIRLRADQWIRRGRAIGFAEPTDFSVFSAVPGLMPAEEALRYFNSLVPSLIVNPQRVLPSLQRSAFTLAVTTQHQIAKQVQNVIAGATKVERDLTPEEQAKQVDTVKQVQNVLADGLHTGRSGNASAQLVDDILKAVGLSPKSPQYAENVVRTNSMDAWNVGQDRERQTPEMMVAFPVFQYVGIADGRERSWHAIHFDKYFPSSMSFVQVRDSEKVSPWNCRCSQIPIDRNTWRDLLEQGAVMSTP